ncbi:glycoside hydrolase 15 protein [Irineochytrium annulatum]|nr:glycoside hydrolase 15 protein [Irineochytrium annulatum]
MLLTTVAAITALVASAAASTQVNLIGYTYDGTTLKGTINVQNLAFNKAIFVKYDTLSGTWSGSCNAVYASGPASNNYETWSFNCPIDSNGIAQFYIEYDVSGTKYYDNGCGQGCNYPVKQGPPPPPPTLGPQADITSWFSSAFPAAVTKLKANIHPANTSPGVVVAAPQSNTINNYFYHWIRDASLVMTAVNDLYVTGDSSAPALFADYQAFTHGIQQIPLQGGLGEAKVLVNGQDFTGGWCRPQNDGPALRASSFIRFANAYLSKTGDMSRVLNIYNGTQGVVVADLNFVAQPANYQNTDGCDLWEERRGIYFWTLGAQRRALHEGAAFAASLGDTANSKAWAAAASTLDGMMNSFFFPNTGLVGRGSSDQKLDAAIPLGAIHNAMADGILSPSDDRILNTAYVFANDFKAEYPINQGSLVDGSGLPLAYAIGRYTGDVYDGSANNNNGGVANPWFLATLAYSELYYKTATAYLQAGKVTVSSLNLPFFSGARPAGLAVSGLTSGTTYSAGSTQFNNIVGSLQSLADSYARTVKTHAGAGFALNEQFSRTSGVATGVNDLTWSYASLISASLARQNMIAVVNGGQPNNSITRRRRAARA